MLSLQKQFSDYWKIGIGLQKVDNLNCSNYLIAIANQQIQGKLAIDDALKQIYLHYQDNCKDNYQKEADIVASRIVKLLTLRSQNPILHVNNIFDSTTHHPLII